MQNVLETINSIRTKNEELITVVGCGGDRDKSKRPKMGHIASALSTKVIFTSDNPRSEVPETIIEDIEKGVEPQNFKKTLSKTEVFLEENGFLRGESWLNAYCKGLAKKK